MPYRSCRRTTPYGPYHVMRTARQIVRPFLHSAGTIPGDTRKKTPCHGRYAPNRNGYNNGSTFLAATTIMTTPDREIYLRDVNTETLIDWLQSQLGPLHVEHRETHQVNLLSRFRGADVPVYILEQTPAKPYSCLWIQSSDVPWVDDLALARSVTQSLNCETRCAADTWQEGDDEENGEWIVVSPAGEKKIIWRG
jgi:hypothetical protein